MFKFVDVEIKYLTPVLFHNGQLADPSNRYAVEMKKITGKHHTKKTDADAKALEDLEWEGSLYLNAERRVVVPGSWIEGAYFEAGKKQRLGKDIRNGLLSAQDWPLTYKGPTDLKELQADPRFRHRCIVRNPSTGGRTARTRPRFSDASLKYSFQYRDDILSLKDLELLTQILGSDIGLSDDRTKMGGRFEIVSFSGR